jgi:hypothetical protein
MMQLFMKLQPNDSAWEMLRSSPARRTMFSIVELPSLTLRLSGISLGGLSECDLESWKLLGADLSLELQSTIAMFHDFYR